MFTVQIMSIQDWHRKHIVMKSSFDILHLYHKIVTNSDLCYMIVLEVSICLNPTRSSSFIWCQSSHDVNLCEQHYHCMILFAFPFSGFSPEQYYAFRQKCFFFLGLMMRNFLLDTDGNQDWTEELWLSSDTGWLIFHFVAHV